MKIEKVNDNQIRCTLTRKDLADRQIKLSELAYGSEKARNLFQDMIQQANYEFGFETNDIPLMVEAIPLSTESIILVITKVEYPDELDTRFSKFSEPAEEYNTDESATRMPRQGADDILGLFKQGVQNKTDTKSEKKEDTEVETETLHPVTNLTKMFEFADINQVCSLSHVLSGYYHGENDLYKDTKKNAYFLMVHKSGHTPAEFNKICNTIAEYAHQKNYSPAADAYLKEHGKLILKGEAVQTLVSL